MFKEITEFRFKVWLPLLKVLHYNKTVQPTLLARGVCKSNSA